MANPYNNLEQPYNFGEIKQDDANWYQRNIVRPSVTWLNTRPGGPLVSLLKTTASFIPGIGEALDVAEGSPGWAAIGAFPILGDSAQAARRVVKEAAPTVTKTLGPTLREIKDTFYNSAKGAQEYVANVIAKHKANMGKISNKNFIAEEHPYPKKLPTNSKDIANKSDLNHTYAMWEDNGETKITLNAFSGRDMDYAGKRAGTELSLFNHFGTSNGKAVYLPNEFRTMFKDKNNMTNLSRMISLKMKSGINRPFSNLTESELKDVLKRGWKTGMFATKRGETFDDFYGSTSNVFRKYMHLIPTTVTGAAMAGTVVYNNEKGDQ